MPLSLRHLRLLSGARREGFLRAVAVEDEPARRAWGRWCMRMRIPVVVWQRASRTARTGRLMLDLCTTPNELSHEGQEAVFQLLSRRVPRGEGSVESVCVEWRGVSARKLPTTAAELYRMATSLGSYQPDMRRLETRRQEMSERLKLPVPIRRRRAAIA